MPEPEQKCIEIIVFAWLTHKVSLTKLSLLGTAAIFLSRTFATRRADMLRSKEMSRIGEEAMTCSIIERRALPALKAKFVTDNLLQRIDVSK